MSTEYEIVLQFPVWVGGLEASTDLRWEIDRHLGHWDEGRYHFSVEMIQHGIERVVEQCIRRSVDAASQKTFGDEMVQVGPGMQTRRSHIETEKLLKDLSVHCRSDGRAVAAAVSGESLEIDDVPKWRVLCRGDRKADGTPGDYLMASLIFKDAETARADAQSVSSSRFPIIVEAVKAEAVLGALNFKSDWWER